MARHGAPSGATRGGAGPLRGARDRATAGPESDDGSRDGTTRGVALPLAAAAVVCLLASSGVWLFSGSSPHDHAPIGLDVPATASATGPAPDGSLPSDGSSGPVSVTDAPGRSAPASSHGSPSPVRTGSTSPRPATHPPTSAPPAPSAPASPTPPAITGTVTVDEQWYGGGVITITNTSTVPMPTWTLTITLQGGRFLYFGDDDQSGSSVTENASYTLAPGQSTQLTYGFAGRNPRSATCTFSAGSCTFPVD